MAKKIIVVLFFIIYIYPVYSEESSKLDIATKEAVIDFNSNEFKAEGGIQFKYNDIDLKAYQLKKFEGMNVVKADEDVIFQKEENKVEAERLILNLDYEEAKMNNAVSYVLVEDAPERHNRLYYGGEEFMAQFPDQASIKNGWFSTSHRALKINKVSQKPEEILPYHMKAKKINVYPGDKVVSYNNLLYFGKVPVLWLPWYATSLKAETQAPLFPKFGSDTKYGSYIIWGFDYGRNNNYLNGSFALRKSSKRGFYIEQWDNVYKVKGNESNSGKLSLSETLLLPSGDYEEQWKFEHTHEYEGEKGKVNWEYQNQTINTINSVEEDQDEAEDEDEDDPYENYEQKLMRYQLETDLKQLGPEEDIALYGKIQYVNNEEVLKEIINSTSEEVLDDYEDAEVDNELETNIKLTKDNRAYKVMLHYDEYEDLDPGSTTEDTKSFKSQREYQVELKKYKLDMYYNNEEQDQWRTLSSSERESDGVKLKELTGDVYNPFTIAKYDVKRETERRVTLGDYSIKEEYKLTLEYDTQTYYEKLNRDDDPFRTDEAYERDREYNRTVDIIEKSTEDTYYDIELSYKTRSAALRLGTYIEEYKDRDDYEETGYDEFKNDSKYRTLELQDTKINLYKLGDLNAKYKLRQDVFAEEDELREHNFVFVFSKELYDNTWDFYREADIKLKNEFGYETLFYNYLANNRSFPDSDDQYIENKNDSKYYRLESKKEERFYEDTVTLDLGNTVTAYNIDMKYYYDAYDTSWKTDEDFENSIDFKVDDERTIYTLYSINNDFQSDGYNNKRVDNWKLTLADAGKEFTYSNSRTVSKVRKSEVDSTENYSERITTYPYLRYEDTNKKDSFAYGFGEKNVKWWALDYTVETNQQYDYYNTSGTALNEYSDDNIKKSYGLGYIFGEENVKAHKVDLDYADYSDSINTKYSYYQYTAEYSYVDNKASEEEKKEEVVYEDSTGEFQVVLTQEEEAELERRFTELNQRTLGNDFNLMGLGEISDDTIYKEYYRVYATAKVDKDYMEEEGMGEAYEELKVRSEFHKERTKVTYEYTEESDITEETDGSHTKEVESKTHEFTFLTKFGKLDHAWKLGGSVKFESYIENPVTERQLDNWSLDIGKEFEYAEWTLGYEVDWSSTYTRYDYVVSFSVNLLTFPEKTFGFKKESDEEEIEFAAGM